MVNVRSRSFCAIARFSWLIAMISYDIMIGREE